MEQKPSLNKPAAVVALMLLLVLILLLAAFIMAQPGGGNKEIVLPAGKRRVPETGSGRGQRIHPADGG